MSQLPCAAVTRHTGLTRRTACVTPTVARRSPSSITPATAAEDAASPEKTDTSPTLPSSEAPPPTTATPGDRKSTRLNSSHLVISYAVFCLKKKKKTKKTRRQYEWRIRSNDMPRNKQHIPQTQEDSS